jgi:hypothetical protein
MEVYVVFRRIENEYPEVRSIHSSLKSAYKAIKIYVDEETVNHDRPDKVWYYKVRYKVED